MKVTIIGTGFVGVDSAAVYASFDNEVIGLDIDQRKVEMLEAGKVPFYEPGLEELLIKQQEKGNLSFTTDYQKAIEDAEVIIIAVGTPSAPNETADLRYVYAASESMAPYLKENAIVVIKSTVPPGTLERSIEIIKEKTAVKFHGASLPEFLREGSAVADTLNPDRIVIGADDQFAFDKLEKLHSFFDAPVVRCKIASAQMAKYTANSYLATRITFINEIANLCEKNGADINEVIEAIGYDKRIGKHYWYPGLGYGGSCFPKDVKELAAYSRTVGEYDNLLNKVNEINKNRIYKLMDRFEEEVGGWKDKTVTVLGLSFKPNTDDMREAPSTKIIPHLATKFAEVRSYDPMANYDEFMREETKHHQQFSSIEEACQGADIIMAIVEWPQISGFDYSSVKEDKKQYFIDARNQITPKKIKDLGFEYIGIGRNK